MKNIKSVPRICQHCGCSFLAFAFAVRRGGAKFCGNTCRMAFQAIASKTILASKFYSTTHGQSGTREYHCWKDMLDRCRNPKHAYYQRYGGRGITVWIRWREAFEFFLMDMGPRPSPRHSIERIDNDGNYEPGNCCWATRTEQASNRSNTYRLTGFGRTQSLTAWAHELNLSPRSVYRRLKRGLTIEECYRRA